MILLLLANGKVINAAVVSRGSLKNVKVEKRVWDLEGMQQVEDLPYSTS